MKRKFLLFLLLVFLIALGAYLNREQAYYNLVVNDNYIYSPSNWRTFSYTSGNVHFQQALDNSDVVRFALAEVSSNDIPKSKETFETLCTTLVSQTYPDAEGSLQTHTDETPTALSSTSNFTSSGNQVTMTFVAPKASNKLYEILEYIPTQDTAEVKAKILTLLP